MKLQTTFDRCSGISNRTLIDMTQELMHAREELMQTGIEMSSANRLVDDLLLGIDIIHNYGKHEGAQATMECLETIVSRTEVDIKESCEGLGSALKAAWDKFIEICKTIYEKIKAVLGKLKDWLFGANNANITKTKKLKERAKAYKPGKESLSAGLESAADEAKYIGRRLPGMALKIAEGTQKVISINLGVIRTLKQAIFANGSDNAEGFITTACNASNGVLGVEELKNFGRADTIELFSYQVYVFKMHREDLHDRFSDDGESSENLSGWNQSYILNALDTAERIGKISEALQANKGLGELSNVSISADDINKLEYLTKNRRTDIPPMKDGSRIENDLKNDKKMLFMAKCCVNAIRVVSTESAFMISELPKIHAFINREIEKVMNALGY